MHDAAPPTKSCKKCGLIKPLTDFYKAKRNSDGYRGSCKDCFRQGRVGSAIDQVASEKTCTRCGETKPLTEFYRNEVYKGGYMSRCKKCIAESKRIENLPEARRLSDNARKREYRKKPEVREQRNKYKRDRRKRNPELVRAEDREQLQRWREKNPEMPVIYDARRRAKIANAAINDFTEQDWKELLWEFDHCCAYCQARGVKLEVDHMTPVSRDGNHTKSNIVPACRSCNASKNFRTIFEFLRIQTL